MYNIGELEIIFQRHTIRYKYQKYICSNRVENEIMKLFYKQILTETSKTEIDLIATDVINKLQAERDHRIVRKHIRKTNHKEQNELSKTNNIVKGTLKENINNTKNHAN